MDNDKVALSYETVWKMIIRPPRDEYTDDLLGDPVFKFNNKKYIRNDYDIISTEGYILRSSFIEPDEDFRSTDEMPVVIYLHGNSSSRMEGLKIAPVLLKRDINIFVFDFAGCGNSEGDYISLGYHEKDDLKIIIDFVEKRPGVGQIGLWGRSMGAATAMLYCHSDDRIFAACLDSPFCDFNRLAKELCLQQVKLPNFLLDTALAFVKRTIKSKNGLDISKLKPIDVVDQTRTPLFFIHAMNDELISIQHSIDLSSNHPGFKIIEFLEVGGHNSVRPKETIAKVGQFFNTYLKPKRLVPIVNDNEDLIDDTLEDN